MQVLLFYRPRSVVSEGLATYVESSLRRRFGSESVREVAGAFSRADQAVFYGQQAVLVAMLGGRWQQPSQTGGERQWDALLHAMLGGIPCIPVLLGDARTPDPGLLPEALAALLRQRPLRLNWGPALGPQLTRLYEHIELGGSPLEDPAWGAGHGKVVPPAYGPSSRPSMYGPDDLGDEPEDDEPVTTILPKSNVLRAMARGELGTGEGDSWARQPYSAARVADGHANTPLSVPPASTGASVSGTIDGGPLEGVWGSFSLWRLRVLGWGTVAALTLVLYLAWFGVPGSLRRELGWETTQLASTVATPAPPAGPDDFEGAELAGVGDEGSQVVEASEEDEEGDDDLEQVALPPEPEAAGEVDLAEPSRKHVMAAIHSVQKDARACGYEGATFVNVTVEGRSGRVINAAADRSIGEASQCIARAVRRARFPRFAKPEFRIKLLLRL